MYDNQKAAKPLKLVLEKLIEINGWQESMAFSGLLEKWEQIVGDNIAQHAKLQKLKQGILFIKTDSSVWRSELLIRQEEIISIINSNSTKSTVISLKIR